MRLSQNGNGGSSSAPPPCPRLYDEVIEIPVVDREDAPPAKRPRVVPMVADWLSDLFEEADDGYE